MIARLRELLDVARAMLRRRSVPLTYKTDSAPSDLSFREAMERNPVEAIRVDLTTPGDDGGERYLASRTHAAPGELSLVATEQALYVDGAKVEPGSPPGLVPCPTCATMQAPRDGHMAVHFASARDQRPCVGSWPARKVVA